jgi:L-idonate 5-dehydrogenase
MQACVLHGAKDLRIETAPEPPLGPHDVRLRTKVGGICGSDLHYFFEGRIGDFVIREPLIPGHEFAGDIVEIGTSVTSVKVGDRVAVHPGRNCGVCGPCREGRGNLCRSVFFMGSASKFPHMQGGFRETLVVADSQCHVVPSNMDYTEIAFAEPLAVTLHAAERAGNLMNRTVLVTGAGPIGQLLLLVARHAGAAHTAVSDMLDAPLQSAVSFGTNEGINVSAGNELLQQASAKIGGYDVVFEASGSPHGLNAAIDAVKVGGTVVQVGSLPAGLSPLIANRIMTKELNLLGSFRFDKAFADAVTCLRQRLIDVRPLLTAVVPMKDASEAFYLAKDRQKSIKVMIGFE